MATKTSSSSTTQVGSSSQSTSSGSAGAIATAALQTALLGLDASTVKALKEVGIRDALTRVLALGSGVLQANLGASSDPTAQATMARLNAGGMTIAAATAIVQKGVTVLGDATDRDSKEAAYHASVGTLKTDLAALETTLANVGSSLRGSFGNTSSELKALGVTPLGGHKPSKKTKAAKAKASSGSAAAAASVAKA